MMKSLKGITAERAHEMLGLGGISFWQQESTIGWCVISEN
jgi:hypothetical protein